MFWIVLDCFCIWIFFFVYFLIICCFVMFFYFLLFFHIFKCFTMLYICYIGFCLAMLCNALFLLSQRHISRGIVVGTFRGGQKSHAKKTSHQYPWSKGALPMPVATTAHVRLLMPYNESTADGWHLCVASNRSPVLVVDVHSMALMAEVSQSHFKYKYGEHYLQVWISNQTVRAIGKAVASNTAFPTKTGAEAAAAVESSRTYYTEEDFARTSVGLKNLQRYIQKMMADYERHFGVLISAKTGLVHLRPDLQIDFDELLARSGSYMKRYMKGNAHFKSLSKEYQALSCLGTSGIQWFKNVYIGLHIYIYVYK